MKLLIAICSLIASFSVMELQATLMEPLPTEELAQQADLIIQAKVLSQASEMEANGHIVTKVQLEVIEVWKGTVTNTPFVLIHGGGTVGNSQAEIAGQASYQVGEEIAAFLVYNQRGEGVTLGLAQGKFEVWTEQSTGEKFARNLFHGSSEKKENVNALTGEKAGQLSLSELKRVAQGGKK